VLFDEMGDEDVRVAADDAADDESDYSSEVDTATVSDNVQLGFVDEIDEKEMFSSSDWR
jgi:hypothetical protein